MLSNGDGRVKLRGAIETVQVGAAKLLSRKVLHVACRVAAERLIFKALKVRNDHAGQPLRCVRSVNALELMKSESLKKSAVIFAK